MTKVQIFWEGTIFLKVWTLLNNIQTLRKIAPYFCGLYALSFYRSKMIWTIQMILDGYNLFWIGTIKIIPEKSK